MSLLVSSSTNVQAPDDEAVAGEAPLQLPDLEFAAEATTPASGEDVARLLIPRLGIDAPIVQLGVLTGGVMESPAAPEVVGWYSFSARPGEAGNAVFAGHRDFAGRGEAAFGDLSRALPGDEVVIEQDGMTHRYQIVQVERYETATAPVDAIVGSSKEALLTLITCTGAFDASTRRYEERLVVKAVHTGGSEQGAVR